LSSWYVFAALGLYPEIPGVAGFALNSPLFPKATIHLENGKVIQILATQSSPENFYIQSLQLNAHDYNSPWIEWSALENGAILNFNLADKPSDWGAKQSPPSFDSTNNH